MTTVTETMTRSIQSAWGPLAATYDGVRVEISLRGIIIDALDYDEHPSDRAELYRWLRSWYTRNFADMPEHARYVLWLAR